MGRLMDPNAIRHAIAYGPAIDELLDNPGERSDTLCDCCTVDELGSAGVRLLDGCGGH